MRGFSAAIKPPGRGGAVAVKRLLYEQNTSLQRFGFPWERCWCIGTDENMGAQSCTSWHPTKKSLVHNQEKHDERLFSSQAHEPLVAGVEVDGWAGLGGSVWCACDARPRPIYRGVGDACGDRIVVDVVEGVDEGGGGSDVAVVSGSGLPEVVGRTACSVGGAGALRVRGLCRFANATARRVTESLTVLRMLLT